MTRVLSLDGGGIKSIISAYILAEIERRAGRPIHSLFDIIAGTSAGGIIALGLTMAGDDGQARYSAADMVKLFEANGNTIFKRTRWDKIRSLGGLSNAKYNQKYVEGILFDYFKTDHLSGALTNILVTSYEIEKRTPFFFKSARAKIDNDYNYPLRDVARATSAAPTYFQPAKIGQWALVDGGVYANNPAMCAYAEALVMYPNTEIQLLSIGTGEAHKRIPYDKAKSYGVVKWAIPILDVVFDGVCDTVDYQLSQILTDKRYLRLQSELKGCSEALDYVTSSNIHNLKALGQSIVNEKSKEIDQFISTL